MSNLNDRFVEALRNSKKVSEADIQKAVGIRAKEKSSLKEVILRLGLISEKELFALLSSELKLPFLNLSKYKIDPGLAKVLPERLARKHKVVPISKIGNVVALATTDPFNIFAIDDVRLVTRARTEYVLSTDKDIEEAIERLYTEVVEEAESLHEIAEAIGSFESDVEMIKSDDDADTPDKDGKSVDAPVVKIVDLLLREAMKSRASDIHIEPFEKHVKVRYRVDGALKEVLTIPKRNQKGIITRIKIMSKIDITESRIPQDGRLKIKMKEKEVDFRVSILPVYHGAKVVMRILDKSVLSVGLDYLGFLPETLGAFKDAIVKPFGMILITGPTGSGKSTTLYSILNQLNTPDKNIITIEDPIEYQVRGITQIQTKTEVGLDFNSGLKSILRQSPDVVMVGEIRDGETADIAIKAALTGQLVLSTLHTNDAPGAMTRLVDMGVEPFLIASSVILVAAQRLARKICLFCKEKIDIPKEVFEELGIHLDKIIPDIKNPIFYKGSGCAKCNFTGYFGRMGILETLVVTDAIRDLVTKRASPIEIKEEAAKGGMTLLRDDALKKFCNGLTTLEEVLRVTAGD